MAPGNSPPTPHPAHLRCRGYLGIPIESCGPLFPDLFRHRRCVDAVTVTRVLSLRLKNTHYGAPHLTSTKRRGSPTVSSPPIPEISPNGPLALFLQRHSKDIPRGRQTHRMPCSDTVTATPTPAVAHCQIGTHGIQAPTPASHDCRKPFDGSNLVSRRFIGTGVASKVANQFEAVILD